MFIEDLLNANCSKNDNNFRQHFLVLSPKEGKLADMEEGIKKPVAHRKELQDPREWRLYSPVLGDDLDRISIRSFGFEWEDMDSYRDWSTDKNPQKHFDENVDKHVANYEHDMSIIDKENSNWGQLRFLGS